LSYELLFTLLEEVIGSSGKKINKGEVIFHCPFCNHRKPKFSIQLDRNRVDNRTNENIFGYWKCWVCQNDGGKGKSIRTLFKKLKATRAQYIELSKILNEPIRYVKSDEVQLEQIKLPLEFIPLWHDSKSIIRNHAISYLEKRGVVKNDLIRYNLGFCEDGRYRNRIIIPSYDECGKLNYFVGRSFYDNSYAYMNPSISRDIIGFELFVNWKLPIILVEGPFDAIASKRNTIPLFGKTISNSLRKRIYQEKVQDIYIALDKDAMKDALKLIELFMKEGINVYLVELESDPSEMGFKKFQEHITQSSKITFYDLVRYKMCK